MATQKEIARKAGVSQCTVSYVLSGTADGGISRETAEKILSLAGKMQYKKRFVPARENGSSIRNIGHFIPPMIADCANDPYYARFISGLTLHAEENSYHITTYNRLSHLMQALLDNLIDGLIVDSNIADKDLEDLKKRIPLVLLNWKTARVPLDSVMPDNLGGIKKSVFHLYSLGHTKISFFGMKPLDMHTRERLRGYIEGMSECGLRVFPDYIQLPVVKKGGVEEIEEFSLEILQNWGKSKNRPTAVVVVGDTYALPFVKVANKLNIRLPEELSVIGFDNRVSCIYSNPSLTSIDQPMEEMAKKSLILLSERMKNPGKPVENVVFDVELVERESVCENREKSTRGRKTGRVSGKMQLASTAG